MSDILGLLDYLKDADILKGGDFQRKGKGKSWCDTLSWEMI